MYTATHTTGIVHHDASYHSRFEAGGVGRKILAVWTENLVYALPHNTRLQGDSLGIFSNGILLPFLATYHKQAVADGLSAKAGTRSTEGDVFTLLVCASYDGLNVLLGGRVEYFLRNKTVETCIGSPRQSFDVSFHCS